MIDNGWSIPDLPIYLRSVSVMSVEGSAPAEVVNAIDKTRTIGTRCKSVTLAAVAAALLAVAYAGLGLDKRSPPTDVVLLQPNKIHFRSLADAPLRPEEKGGGTDWAASPLTVTVMPVAYSHRTEPGRRARILDEFVDLVIAGASQAYRAIYIVEITDALCGERWFCIKGNAGIETLEPGASIRRETMFVPVRPDATSWRSFVDTVLTSQDLTVSVTYRASVEVSEDAGPKRLDMRVDCRIDTREMRNEMGRRFSRRRQREAGEPGAEMPAGFGRGAVKIEDLTGGIRDVPVRRPVPCRCAQLLARSGDADAGSERRRHSRLWHWRMREQTREQPMPRVGELALFTARRPAVPVGSRAAGKPTSPAAGKRNLVQ